MVFVNPCDLSYHNFENIISLDMYFKDINLEADNFIKLSENKKYLNVNLKMILINY